MVSQIQKSMHMIRKLYPPPLSGSIYREKRNKGRLVQRISLVHVHTWYVLAYIDYCSISTKQLHTLLYSVHILLSFSPSDILTIALSLPAWMMAANRSSGFGSNMTSNTSSVSTKKSEMIVMSVQTELPHFWPSVKTSCSAMGMKSRTGAAVEMKDWLGLKISSSKCARVLMNYWQHTRWILSKTFIHNLLVQAYF